MQPNPPAQIVKFSDTQMREALFQPDVMGQFESILGKSTARHYVGSVMIAYANSPELQECHPDSIIRSALRCAAFELSCDPAAKQGQLVPYWNDKRKRKEAQLIIHYKGMSLLAMRSGLYRHLNVSKIYKGYTVEQDILTGLHTAKLDPAKFDTSVLIGFLGYIETKSGFKKTVYWTVEEIKVHAAKFAPKNPLYQPSSKHYETMLEKTVWRDLMTWADLGGTRGADTLAAAFDEADEVIDAEGYDPFESDPQPEPLDAANPQPAAPAEISPAEAAYIQACEVTASDGESYCKKLDAYLRDVIRSEKAPDEKKKAAQIIIDHRAAVAAKAARELGF